MKLLPTSRRAATAIEYGLLAAGIGVVIFAAVTATGGDLRTVFGALDSHIVAADAASSSTETAPVDENFSSFQAAASGGDLGCDTTPAFEAPDGTAVTISGCNPTMASQNLYTDLNNGGFGVVFYSPSGGTITVPALGGDNTGFSLPAIFRAPLIWRVQRMILGTHSSFTLMVAT